MKPRSKKQKILTAAVFLFLASQAIRPAKNNGNLNGPKDIAAVLPVPDSVMSVLQKSCYDCHSDRTEYPWYDEITPVNWWVSHHVAEGKRELNFTRFATYTPKKQDHKLEEIAESVEKDFMPLKSYLWMHGDAKLSDSQKKAIIAWAAAARQKIQR